MFIFKELGFVNRFPLRAWPDNLTYNYFMGIPLAILGGGNIGISMARGLVKSGKYVPSEISITRRNTGLLADMAELGYHTSHSNSVAVARSGIIMLSVLPQQLNALLEEIKPAIDSSRHLVISVVTGVSISDIKHILGINLAVTRAMPNTAIAVGQSMTCLSYDELSSGRKEEIAAIFETVGIQTEIKEELMIPATALAACSIAFFLRAIRAATQGGVEIGFHASDALKIALQVAKGASMLLENPGTHPEREIDKVTSPRGCTIAGLNEMEHYGFSSAMIRGIKTSADKAGKLYEKSND